MLAWVLDTSLKIAHPFTPFVTETIWQSLEWHNDLLLHATWPEAPAYDEIAAGEFERLQKLVIEARYVMAELPGNERYTLLYQQDTLIADNKELITHLARLKGVAEADQPRGLRLAASNREAWLDISKETMYEHQSNLEVRLAETRQFIATLEGRLANETYISKAPAALVEESRAQLEAKKALVVRLQDELTVLS
jgi:valyl-tRNA synthetase